MEIYTEVAMVLTTCPYTTPTLYCPNRTYHHGPALPYLGMTPR